MKSLNDFNFKGERVLVRVDFNVPLNDAFQVTDDTRIRASLPTIQYLLENGASVVLMSHLGRPKGGPEDKFSLRHTLPALEHHLKQKVKFASDCISEEAFQLSSRLQPGEVLLLENLRFYKEEEKGDAAFAEKLSKHGTFYVNDAFGTAHRAHASTAVIARFFASGKKCLGFLMGKEVENLNKVLYEPRRPLTAVVGGAKVSDKILILKSLLEKADNVIIGGGMAFTFISAQGGKIGKSLCETDRINDALDILNNAKSRGIRILLPVDVLAHSAFEDKPGSVYKSDEIPEGQMGLDIGPQSIEIFSKAIMQSGSILWNGPMGVFEMENYQEGTRKIGEAIAQATQKGAFSLVGGGDSVAAASKYNLSDKLSYISTGGGAMLEYVEQGTLPGVEAVKA
ncbi:MAG: phosphoglycerate kinase [Bacteroidia bacterium]|nr:phosphoglycerate kinase [Bacteroidia bacterium]